MNFKEWFEATDINEHTTLSEATTSTRYSVEANFRSNMKEVMESFAKIALGYVSAALKQNGYHIKHVYEEEPIRILVSTRNWDDGEWVGMASFNPTERKFYISKGYLNKPRKTISLQGDPHVCEGDSAADVTKAMRNLMFELKGDPGRHQEPLKGVPLKRGPKK